MTSVKLINHSSSTADWNYYVKLFALRMYIRHHQKDTLYALVRPRSP